MPDTLHLKPPADSEADAPVPAAAPPAAGPTKVCPYCGHDIPEAATICKYCEEPLEPRARRRHREPAGNWSLLSARASATRGVSFQQMVQWVRDGTINENSSVSGPTTGFQWRFASETPRLSRHLGVCYQCGAPVEPSDEVCAACRVRLDGSGDREVQRTGTTPTRRTRLLRIAAAISFVLAALVAGGCLVAFTPVGRLVLTESAQQRVRETVEGLLIRAEEQAGTRLPDEIDTPAASPERDREARAERLMGDALMAEGKSQAALTHYLKIKRQFADTPAAEGIDEKITAARAAAAQPIDQ